MTKAELIAAITNLADDTKVLIESWPPCDPQPECGELYPLTYVATKSQDENGESFIRLSANL